jgi:hypothetical protein
MTQYTIKIHDYKHLGNPKNSINFDDFGYFVVEKIPMFISSSSSVHKNNKLTFIAAMLFSKKHFPVSVLVCLRWDSDIIDAVPPNLTNLPGTFSAQGISG